MSEINRTKLDGILQKINQLSSEELEMLLNAILNHIKSRKRVKEVLDKYIGIGKGVWEIDAQKYVNNLRSEIGS